MMDDTAALALAVLRLCDAIEDGGTNAVARMDATNRARKHAHTVLDRNGATGHRVRCSCPDEIRGECDCRVACICEETE